MPPLTADQDGVVAATYTTDHELLSAVLRPYWVHCQYLKTAVVKVGRDDEPTVAGDFEIGESCYINETGHFNAVEFNICYNQLAYYLIAKSVKEGLLPALRNWTLEDFWRLQLPDILIVDFRSSFKRKMRGKSFSGSVSVTDVVCLQKSDCWNPLIVLYTSCLFWDEPDGLATGKVTLAITNPA